MRKLLLLLFLLSISSNAFAEEVIMRCDDTGTFKYVKKLIAKDKVYHSEKATWVEWCGGKYKARKYNASCIDEKGYQQNLDFTIRKHYHEGYVYPNRHCRFLK
jgi:hypothetical protein